MEEGVVALEGSQSPVTPPSHRVLACHFIAEPVLHPNTCPRQKVVHSLRQANSRSALPYLPPKICQEMWELAYRYCCHKQINDRDQESLSSHSCCHLLKQIIIQVSLGYESILFRKNLICRHRVFWLLTCDMLNEVYHAQHIQFIAAGPNPAIQPLSQLKDQMVHITLDSTWQVSAPSSDDFHNTVPSKTDRQNNLVFRIALLISAGWVSLVWLP